MPALVAQEVASPLLRKLIGLVWQQAKAKALATIDGMMLADLLRRDQIEDGMGAGSKDRLRDFKREEREVFAALALADYDARTVSGLVESLKLARADVETVLQRAMALESGAVHRVARFRYDGKDGEPAYTLASRTLSGWKNFSAAIPGLNRIAGVTVG